MAKLTTTDVAGLVKRPGKYGGGDGLWLHVGDAQRARWFLHYGSRTKQCQMSLGSLAHVSLADARGLAAAERKRIAAGGDPLEARRAEQAAMATVQAQATTFAQASAAYIAAHQASWRNPKHRYQWRATLDHANAFIGANMAYATLLRPLSARGHRCERWCGRPIGSIRIAVEVGPGSILRRNCRTPGPYHCCRSCPSRPRFSTTQR